MVTTGLGSLIVLPGAVGLRSGRRNQQGGFRLSQPSSLSGLTHFSWSRRADTLHDGWERKTVTGLTGGTHREYSIILLSYGCTQQRCRLRNTLPLISLAKRHNQVVEFSELDGCDVAECP